MVGSEEKAVEVHTYTIAVIGHTDFGTRHSPAIMNECTKYQGLALIIAKILSSVMEERIGSEM
jgi:hypothetical protein